MNQYRESEHRNLPQGQNPSSHTESPAAIKADIEHTRAEMGAKIDRIKARMDPEQLKAQAQETVNEMLTETANSVSDYVRTNRRQLTESVVDTIKHNPIPAALIGVGLGWMFVEAFTSDDRSGDKYSPRRSNYRGRSYREPMAYDRYGPGYEDVGYYRPGRPYGAYNGPYQSDAEGMHASYDGDTWVNNSENLTGSQEDSMVGQVRDQARHAGEQIQHGAEQASEQIKHAAQETAGQIRHSVDAAGRQVQAVGGQVSHQAQRVGEQIGRQAAELGRAGAQVRNQAQRQALHAGDQVQRSLEDHPTSFGAMAFAAGIAIGFMLPQTRTENRMLGETRNQVMESGQAVARDVAQRAQQVVEEVAPEVKETARHVAEDLRETGRQAYAEVRETAQKVQEEAKQTLQKAEEKARTEGEQAKQKAKEEAAKVEATAEQEMTSTGAGADSKANATSTARQPDDSRTSKP